VRNSVFWWSETKLNARKRDEWRRGEHVYARSLPCVVCLRTKLFVQVNLSTGHISVNEEHWVLGELCKGLYGSGVHSLWRKMMGSRTFTRRFPHWQSLRQDRDSWDESMQPIQGLVLLQPWMSKKGLAGTRKVAIASLLIPHNNLICSLPCKKQDAG
jgi:hypothetical protein